MTESVIDNDGGFTVKLPLIYLRGVWLVLTAIFWYMFWATTANIMGWDWEWPNHFLLWEDIFNPLRSNEYEEHKMN